MRFVLTLVAASAMLVACGGGGGDSAPGEESTPIATPATLTRSNYVAAAQEAFSSADYLTTTTDFATGAQVSDPQVLIRFGQDQLPKLSDWLAGAPAQAVGAVTNQTEPCDGGGSLAISVNDANGNQLGDAGDSVSVTATNCLVEGERVNGQLLMTIKSMRGNPEAYPYAMSIYLRLNNLRAESSSVRVVGNGTLLVDVDARSIDDDSLALSTSSFTLAGAYSGVPYSQKLTNYSSSTVTKPTSTGVTSSTAVSGTLGSSAFESKSITIDTPTPFVRVNAQPYPHKGQMLVTGAAGAKVRITATSATTVLIELDADANGSYETTTSKLWSEML